MGRLLEIVTPFHKAAKRDFLARMVDDKVHCMLKAKEYEFDYWDGDRRYGYGGYKYDGRWKVVAEKLISIYHLAPDAKILDVGCGKAYVLYELQQLLTKSTCVGFDVSRHGLADAPEGIRGNLFRYRAQDAYPFGDKHFDLVISMGCLHNLRLFEFRQLCAKSSALGRTAMSCWKAITTNSNCSICSAGP